MKKFEKQFKLLPVIVFVGLIAVWMVVIGDFALKKLKSPKLVQVQKTADAASQGQLPISLDNPTVTSGFAHYFLTGKLAEIRDSQGGKVLVLENVSAEIPEIVVTQNTRVSKITPPYSSQTSQIIPASELKAGQNLDISMEYDLKNKTWATLDVFVPTDKN